MSYSVGAILGLQEFQLLGQPVLRAVGDEHQQRLEEPLRRVPSEFSVSTPLPRRSATASKAVKNKTRSVLPNDFMVTEDLERQLTDTLSVANS